MSRPEPLSTNPTPTSLTPPLTQEPVTMDTSMAEAPSMEPASTTARPSPTAADRANQNLPQEIQQQHYSASEQAPLVTGTPTTNTFSREHQPREPTPRQPTPRQYDNTPPDRKRPHPSSYPSAPESLLQTPHHGMSAPLAPSARTGTPADRVPPLSSYPTAPASASQTPQSGRSQTPQQGVSTAGWLVSPASSSSSRITFEGTFWMFLSLSLCPVSCLVWSFSFWEKMIEERKKRGEKTKSPASNNNAIQTTSPSQKSPSNGATATTIKTG